MVKVVVHVDKPELSITSLVWACWWRRAKLNLQINCWDQGFGQDLETGCPTLANGKFWGVLFYKGDHKILILQPAACIYLWNMAWYPYTMSCENFNCILKIDIGSWNCGCPKDTLMAKTVWDWLISSKAGTLLKMPLTPRRVRQAILLAHEILGFGLT